MEISQQVNDEITKIKEKRMQKRSKYNLLNSKARSLM